MAESDIILLVGLPSTGKTNYLVGLDYILDNQAQVEGLVHQEHAADRAYLEPLRSQWLQGKVLDHTRRSFSIAPHQMILSHRPTGREAKVYVPDMAGETFDDQFKSRSFTSSFADLVMHARGLMLFIHCDHEADHELLDHPHFIDADTSEVQPHEAEAEWTIEKAAKQTRLVDILQFVESIRNRPLRLAVAISAWDMVDCLPDSNCPKDPSRFLQKHWPLLDQYLVTNHLLFPSRVFGVSARGGGDSPEDIRRLTQFTDASERVKIVDGAHCSQDLTRPIRWLLGLLREDGQ